MPELLGVLGQCSVHIDESPLKEKQSARIHCDGQLPLLFGFESFGKVFSTESGVIEMNTNSDQWSDES